MKPSEIISLDSESFEALVDRLICYIKKTHVPSNDSKWIQADEAKKLLGISSNGSLQKLRNEGRIRYSQPAKKVILYDRESLTQYIESHSKNTF